MEDHEASANLKKMSNRLGKYILAKCEKILDDWREWSLAGAMTFAIMTLSIMDLLTH
jgi:hypothetical protein